MNPENVKPGLMVHALGSGEMRGARGTHVGTVDHIEGDFVLVDVEGGAKRWMPFAWVASMDDLALYLNRSAEEFESGTGTEKPQVSA